MTAPGTHERLPSDARPLVAAAVARIYSANGGQTQLGSRLLHTDGI